MVSSGIRRDIWERRGFLESMQYSEDDEYTRWCRAQGFRVAYCPESLVTHSHNYNRRQAYKRSFGEAWALTAMGAGPRTGAAWTRIVVLGWINDARRDLAFCVRKGRLREWPHSWRIRLAQRLGKLAGFRAGMAMHPHKVQA
jgi:rhamnosyltransferase